MSIADALAAKRDRRPLSAAQIEEFARDLADNSLPDAQAGAMAMAIAINGMDAAETAALTRAFIASGEVIDWGGSLPGAILDKHSTGGVGDKVSLMLAAIIAACGGFVPMISGRGLGHTGGTLDKLASIPGYNAFPGLDRFRAVVRDVGCAIIGQTGELAPADRRLYAIRDVTGTIDSLPLITASILSKKAAAGVRGLIMDIKTGSGAFMVSEDRAVALAESLIASAGSLGIQTLALVTDMDQVLGTTAGNALEIREAIDYLTGRAREPRLHEVTIALAAEMLAIGDIDDGAARVERALASGAAAEHFARMVAALGGPTDLLERPALPEAPVVLPACPATPSYLAAMDVRAVGEAIVELGGGRHRPDDDIDPRVGLSDVASLGDPVGPDRPIALVHAASQTAAEQGVARIRAACIVAPERQAATPLIRARIGSGGE